MRLDYYTRTVFEFISKDIGSQGTVCGGGRYDGLIEECGGKPTPAVGFAIGIERLLMVMEAGKDLSASGSKFIYWRYWRSSDDKGSWIDLSIT